MIKGMLAISMVILIGTTQDTHQTFSTLRWEHPGWDGGKSAIDITNCTRFATERFPGYGMDDKSKLFMQWGVILGACMKAKGWELVFYK